MISIKVEGILILVGITSYCSIVKVINEHQYYCTERERGEAFIFMLVFGWFVFPFWIIYKFWEWLLVVLPEQIKEWRRKRNAK